MGTKYTAAARLSKVRQTFINAKKRGEKLVKKKFIALLCLDGYARQTARETLSSFVDSGEVIESINEEGDVLLEYGKPIEEIEQTEAEKIISGL